ncbi:hypothetical protein [Microbacterium sp. BDGP8]|uniref:hypothetical protein n=1 Tax=Microbacterium sp. BDGP8 TaxID=3035531 RepID=UPI00249DAEBD|nr:hypothetical protein [Microbacterium sp. BDGP8]WHE37795.1 hypothetical protein P6897_16085 [Microbacterium sp. BDGP8]
MVRAYVESFERPDGKPDLRLREKVTRRIIRVLSGDPLMHQITPLATLMAECYSHGHGLTKATGRDEHIAIAAPVVGQTSEEVCFWLDQNFVVTVRIQTAAVVSPPTSVWCFIEKYSSEDGQPGLRLREKGTGRKVEMYGETKDQLIAFLASPQATGYDELLANLYEKDGYRDYVLVSGGTTVDTYDVIRYEYDSKLTYIIGPTTDTAYRDAFRVMEEETAATAHARTAATHLRDGRYREAVLYARLAIEAACGGRGLTVANRLADAPEVSKAAMALNELRHTAVHGLDTRIEQHDAEEAVRLMNQVLEHVLGSR